MSGKSFHKYGIQFVDESMLVLQLAGFFLQVQQPLWTVQALTLEQAEYCHLGCVRWVCTKEVSSSSQSHSQIS